MLIAKLVSGVYLITSTPVFIFLGISLFFSWEVLEKISRKRIPFATWAGDLHYLHRDSPGDDIFLSRGNTLSVMAFQIIFTFLACKCLFAH
jgi:hypothetical protein